MQGIEPGAGLAFAADGGTAVAAGFNAAWLVARGARDARTDARRLAARTLALLNAGVAAQAAFAQALYTAHRFDLATEPFFATAPWLASRAALLAGTLLLSLLILRRRAR